MTSQLCQRPSVAGDPHVLYLREIDSAALLSATEEKFLARQIAEGSVEARDHLVRANLRLVANIARGYAGKGVEVQDLIEEGNLGLLRAVEGFDPSMNTRFSTYATYWIKQSIKRGLINSMKTVRVPAYMATLVAKWRRATNALTDDLGRPPAQEEVARYLGVSAKKMRVIQKAIQIYNSGAPAGKDAAGWDITDIPLDVPPPRPGQEEVNQVLALLDRMDERDAAVLRMRFGLDGQPPMTLKEVGDNVGLTRERVRQIARAALSKLAQQLGA